MLDHAAPPSSIAQYSPLSSALSQDSHMEHGEAASGAEDTIEWQCERLFHSSRVSKSGKSWGSLAQVTRFGRMVGPPPALLRSHKGVQRRADHAGARVRSMPATLRASCVRARPNGAPAVRGLEVNAACARRHGSTKAGGEALLDRTVGSGLRYERAEASPRHRGLAI